MSLDRSPEHEAAAAAARQLGFIFVGELLERVTDVIVHHHAREAAAALDLPGDFMVIHWLRRVAH